MIPEHWKTIYLVLLNVCSFCPCQLSKENSISHKTSPFAVDDSYRPFECIQTTKLHLTWSDHVTCMALIYGYSQENKNVHSLLVFKEKTCQMACFFFLKVDWQWWSGLQSSTSSLERLQKILFSLLTWASMLNYVN